MDSLKIAAPQEAKLHFLDYWRIIRIRKTVILAVFLLVVITATLVTFILPESFASTARIKVDRDISDIRGLTDAPYMSGYDPYFIQTEFEVIQSDRILSNVVQHLNLQVEWGKKYAGGDRLKTPEAMMLLRGRMDLRPVRNTSFIEIRVFSENAEEAARIANMIAETYREYRLDQRRDLTMGGIRTLEERFEEQEKKVQKAQREVDAMRAEYEVSDFDSAGTGPSPVLEAETLRRLEGLRIEGEAQYVREDKLLQELKATPPEDLKKVLPTAIPDVQLSELLQQLNVIEQERIRLKKDLTDDHPSVATATRQIEDIEAKIAQRAEGVIKGLETRVTSMKAYLDSLISNVDKAKKVDIAKAEKSRPYFDARQRLEEAIRFRSILNMKLASERIDVELPRTTMVEIMDPAKPGVRPVRPNKTLNIALGVIIGLIVGVGLAFFIEYLDTSVKTIDDVERALQSPVLGVIPQNVGSLLQEGAESPHAEAYRVLRTNLLFSRKDDKLNTIAVVSAGAGEGKTTTVFNLATVFAQSNQRVIIVDSDLRRPALHKRFGVTNALGLTNYLLKQNQLEEVIQTSSLATLDFLPSGKLPSSSLGILSSAQMKDLITQLKQRYDFVFFDSPPIMGVSDASILASEVDMTLQVIQYRRYPQPMNIRAKQLIEKVGGNLIGIVLNNINMSQDESYYYYSGYYHDYYYRSDESQAKAETASEDKAKDDKSKVEIKQKY
jgi:capsular exopolysaccharide synthesis family protein